MKKCLNCYREVEDDKHVICPDCGYVLHKGDEMSSEDADDGVFQHRDTEAQRKQRGE